MSANDRQPQQQQMQQQQTQDQSGLNGVFARMADAGGHTLFEEVRMPNGRTGYRPITFAQVGANRPRVA